MTATLDMVDSQRRSVRAPALRRSSPLLVLAWIVALCVLAPLVFLVVQAAQAGWKAIADVLFRGLTGALLVNTVEMTALVTVIAAVLGTFAALVLERTDVPMRRALSVLLIVPAAIPDFIETFGWVNAAPWLRGLWGAVFVLSLAVYPFVMLPAAAALRRTDPRHEEVARSLGASRLRVALRVTIPEIRGAIAGGCLLVALQLLAEYGSFEMLGFRTFTTEIFTSFQVGFDAQTACGLSLVLVLLSALLVRGEASVGRRERGLIASEAISGNRMELGRWRLPVLTVLIIVIVASLGVPVGSIISLLIDPGTSTLPSASLMGAAVSTLLYAIGAAVLASIGAAVIAVGTRRSRSWLDRTPSTVALVPLAVPGVVLALAFSFAASRTFDGRWYQTSILLVIAYAVMFLPLALIGIRSSLDQVPESLTEVASSLGVSGRGQIVRVVLPLILPGLGAGFALVFLSTVTELTATLVLVPTGVQTLATDFWSYQTNLSYGQAAPYAALMILLAGPPLILLTRMGERRGARIR